MPPNEPNTVNHEEDTVLAETKVIFNNEKEEEDCKKMVELLTDEELEEVANMSYSYYSVVSTEDGNNDKNDHDNQLRYQTAMKFAKQHLTAEKFDVDKSLKRLRRLLTFRKENKLNDLRLCFSAQSISSSNDDDDGENNNNELLKSQIIEETSRQLMYVRGYDKENRAILIKQDRTAPVIDEKACFNTHIYMLERAIACTESMSNGAQHQIVVVLNYTNYIRANAVPMNLMKEYLTTIESCYPDNLAYLLLVDVPFYFKVLWCFLKPFLDPNNADKIKFVTGEEQREEILGPLIDEDQAMPFLLPNGKLSPDIDISHFLNEVPYDCDYDSKINK